MRAAVEAIDPSALVASALRGGVVDPDRTPGFTVVAAGKAAWSMAVAFARHSPVRAGLIAGPRVGRAEISPPFEWFDAGHPLPDAVSERAGRRALGLARGDRDSALVVLLSGGASAMLAVPAEGLDLEEKRQTTDSLLRAGVAIDALNCVRKHLSAIKGGQLAAGAGASIALAISDVHGPVPDHPAIIGSGPTVADPTTFAEAAAIVRRAVSDGAPEIPAAVVRRLDRGARGEIEETPKPGDPRLVRCVYHVIGNRKTATDGAARAARALGYAVEVLDAPTSGEARVAGERFVRAAARIARSTASPVCVIASGETTVRVRGDGRGGRNQEFALGMAAVLAEVFRGPDASAIAASVGTDGIDGPTDAAGALVDPESLARAARAGVDPGDALARHDTYPFFQQLGDLVVWGPTGTNVGDLHVLLKW
jgi:glycerate-2-kinase